MPADLNLTRLSIIHHLLNVKFTNNANQLLIYSLKTYAIFFWAKDLEELDFAGISNGDAVQLVMDPLKIFRNGQNMLEMFSEMGCEFVETWFCKSSSSSLVRRIITEDLNSLNGREQ